MSVTLQPPAPAEAEPSTPAPPSVSPDSALPPWRDLLTRRNVLAGVAAVWLLSGVFMVPPEEQAVTTCFGSISDERVLPGVHYNWPWPVGSVFRLKVRQLQREVVGGEIVDNIVGTADPVAAQFITGDQNIIHVRTVVQYSVATPKEYLFRAVEVNGIVKNAVEAELGRQIAAREVDAVLTTEKPAIQEAVRGKAQGLVDRYGLGIVVSTVNIEQATAPPEAAEAFRDVAGARADAARIVNEAEGYANDTIPRARGEARQLQESARGFRNAKIARSEGDAARFTALTREYAKNPEVTRRRLYLETMEEVLPRLKKTIVDDDGNLDLTIMRRGQSNRQPPGDNAP